MTFEPPVPPPPPALPPLPPSPPPGETAAVPSTAAPDTAGGAVASTVIGGIALLLSPLPVINVLTGVAAIVGAVLGILALVRRTARRGLAVLGVVLCVVALLVSTALSVVYIRMVIEAASSGGGWFAEEPFEEPPVDDFTAGGITRVDGAPLGTVDAPDPLGTVYSVDDGYGGEFEVEFVGSGPAVDAVFDDYPGVDPLPTGWSFQELRVQVVNTGDVESYVADALVVEYIGATRAVYDSYAYTATTAAEQFDYLEPLAAGATTTASVLVAVRGDDVAGGTWRISEYAAGSTVVVAP